MLLTIKTTISNNEETKHKLLLFLEYEALLFKVEKNKKLLIILIQDDQDIQSILDKNRNLLIQSYIILSQLFILTNSKTVVEVIEKLTNDTEKI